MDTIYILLVLGCLGAISWSGWNYFQFLKLKTRDWQSEIGKFLQLEIQ